MITNINEYAFLKLNTWKSKFTLNADKIIGMPDWKWAFFSSLGLDDDDNNNNS